MPVRAVVDTHVWVRCVLARRRGASQVILEAVEARHFELIASEPLLAEISIVLHRPKLMRKHGRSLTRIDTFLSELRQGARVVPITGELRLCRDPKDDALIETAVEGGAFYVVSDDTDLHALEVTEYLSARGCRVVKVSEFLRELYPPDTAGAVPEG